LNVFELRNRIIDDYSKYVRSFIHIKDDRIRSLIERELDDGLIWPEPLIQLNPAYSPGATIDALVNEGILHPECSKIFRRNKTEKGDCRDGEPLRLYKHQEEAIRKSLNGHNYVLTSGTGSGKSLAYIVPIVNHILKNGPGKGIQAIIVYPMNALANSQIGELDKFLKTGYPADHGPVTYARYTGQEKDEERQAIIANPPDIILTNYVMLELILTRTRERSLIQAAKGLRFLVLDELHTYRGRQGADVAMLIRRAREYLATEKIQCIGTSATLAGKGHGEDPRTEVAELTTRLFGGKVDTDDVVMETLIRVTPELDIKDKKTILKLKERVKKGDEAIPKTVEGFVTDPLSSWLESIVGIEYDKELERLVRALPSSIKEEGGLADTLSKLVEEPLESCQDAIEKHLLASYECQKETKPDNPLFAFRLHQFISRGGTPFASMGYEEDRYITVQPQRFVPGQREAILYPLVFCRECGQEYYCIKIHHKKEENGRKVNPRIFSDHFKDEEGVGAYAYASKSNPWPHNPNEIIKRLPDDWIEEKDGRQRIKSNRREYLPVHYWVNPDGEEGKTGTECVVIPYPFRFCLNCGVSYNFRQKIDFMKLLSMEAEGRSTATTILTLGAIRYLQKDSNLSQRARKLLSFTDNRQDASLQAGHFNDFVEIGVLRSGVFKAVQNSGPEGLKHEEIVQRTFDALDLPLDLYAVDPGVKYQALDETKRALKEVLGYRLYRDLKRGWRITTPNLEQCGLLKIKYMSLDEVCRDDEIWKDKHETLGRAAPETRYEISHTLLDYMRRELAIKIEYLTYDRQERIRLNSFQRLKAPWAVDENETMETSAVLYPRPLQDGDYGGNVHLSPRSQFGNYLRRMLSKPKEKIPLKETSKIIIDLLEALRVAGLVEIIRRAKEDPGYQLPASAMVWVAGNGTEPLHDPIRVPFKPDTGFRTNPFFIEFYTMMASDAKGIEAHEHTAQVNAEVRIERERDFREGRLPILFCSPTMELGVDIAELNVVNLRNVPPTPANYAQRSGRAGRGGQPALVFTYCSQYSPHDQYFFKRPYMVVSGAVVPPRIELANEELIRAHVNAIWLTETGLNLGESLIDLLDLSGSEPTLKFLPSVEDSIRSDYSIKRALDKARQIMNNLTAELEETEWYDEKWLEETLNQTAIRFDQACERWRGLYMGAFRQQARQNKIALDASRPQPEKEKAKRLRGEAEAQLGILTKKEHVWEADFYSYRYFASEGFLPGYNFPRLPLSAYIPGRREKGDRSEFLSRPRFIAISEFGPRAIVYHEGSRYRIKKVIMPVPEEGATDVLTNTIKLCQACGYLHIMEGDTGADICEVCKSPLTEMMTNLFRLQNVSTERADKISSDEEERRRIGYEIKTAVKFSKKQGRTALMTAQIMVDSKEWGKLYYGPAADIWRINLGWSRRANKNQFGFSLDVEKGYWVRNEQDDEDSDDPYSARTQRVIPYVEDHRNILILQPANTLSKGEMASLQAALKTAIQIEYQLEEMEIAAEPLPRSDDRKSILFYEAAEGGAGVLRNLVKDAHALSRVVSGAIFLCHYDQLGHDRKRNINMTEDCEAACYDCLLSYSNQRDHHLLDRQLAIPLLQQLLTAKVVISPGGKTRAEQLAELMRLSQSSLEREWLDFLEKGAHNLPDMAQTLIRDCGTRPDFLYKEHCIAIYIDGPPHDFKDRQDRDKTNEECLHDLGYTVIRFHHQQDWMTIIKKYPNIFGVAK